MDTTDIATPAQLAERYDTTTAALAQDRYRGRGPKFFKRGARVYYRWADVYAWEQENTREITGEKVPA